MFVLEIMLYTKQTEAYLIFSDIKWRSNRSSLSFVFFGSIPCIFTIVFCIAKLLVRFHLLETNKIKYVEPLFIIVLVIVDCCICC
jgi:hypothetical protein